MIDMGKFLIKLIIIVFVSTNICYASNPPNTIKKYSLQWACCFQQYVFNHIKYRATIYNALNLTDEQAQIFNDNMRENFIYYKEKTDQIIKICEQYQYEKHLSNQQKRIIYNLLKEIKNFTRMQDKFLKKNLTSLQKSKYNLIIHLEKQDSKRDCQGKDYYKPNPEMLYFGAWAQCP